MLHQQIPAPNSTTHILNSYTQSPSLPLSLSLTPHTITITHTHTHTHTHTRITEGRSLAYLLRGRWPGSPLEWESCSPATRQGSSRTETDTGSVPSQSNSLWRPHCSLAAAGDPDTCLASWQQTGWNRRGGGGGGGGEGKKTACDWSGILMGVQSLLAQDSIRQAYCACVCER